MAEEAVGPCWCPMGQTSLTDAGYIGHIIEMALFRLPACAVLLESLKKFEQNFLGDFTPSSFQVSEAGESELGVQIMGHGIEWSPQRHFGRCIRPVDLVDLQMQ